MLYPKAITIAKLIQPIIFISRIEKYCMLRLTSYGRFLWYLFVFFVSKISEPMKQISMAAENLRVGKQVQIPPNRVGLERYLEAATKESAQIHNKLMFVCLDLDGFKGVNDTYGHHIGDILLQEVAQRLSKLVNDNEFVARLGGDEFVLIAQAHKFSTEDAVQDFAQNIIFALNESFVIGGHSLHVGCSLGVAFWNEKLNPKDVLKNADEALYNSKHNGKNQATFYTNIFPYKRHQKNYGVFLG